MKAIDYQKAWLQTKREYDFWNGVFATPPGGRTRAQRKHIATRQKRGRLLALEVVARGRNPMALVPTPAQLFKPAEDDKAALVDRARREIEEGVSRIVDGEAERHFALEDPALDDES